MFKFDTKDWGPATVLVVLAAAVVLIVGGVVVIVGNGLTFQEYLDDIIKTAGALGILGVGRGIALHGSNAPTPASPVTITAEKEIVAQ